MEETYEELKAIFEGLEEDAQKFYNKGQKAAGKRIRKGLMEIKKKAHELRQEIQDEINSM